MGETILGSRYEIIRKIGDGGMAFVYEAKDRLLNRIVAVKVLRPEFVDDEDILKENRRKGIGYFRDTYGFVNYDEYANMSSGLIGGIQGHYGGDKSSGKKDMQGMTESALL